LIYGPNPSWAEVRNYGFGSFFRFSIHPLDTLDPFLHFFFFQTDFTALTGQGAFVSNAWRLGKLPHRNKKNILRTKENI
jgi:hypothetical protein